MLTPHPGEFSRLIGSDAPLAGEAKLNALLELDPLLDNAFYPLYASPVRPDPRPLQGVLLAVHAFLPVARLYQVMAQREHPLTDNPHFDRRYLQIVRGNHEGSKVLLEHGQATTIGAGLLDEIRRWDQHFAPDVERAQAQAAQPLTE